MAAELITRAEQLALVDGVRLDSVCNILVGEQVAKLPFARGRGRLYVLVEPLGDRTGWETVCRELAQVIHDEYYENSGSVTSGLRRAIERANNLLCDINAAEARRAPRLAGVSAVVIKGNDAFVAQTGPALVYVVKGEVAARFPEDSPWLDMSPRQAMEEGYAPPLGLRNELSVDLFHTQLSPGDRLVVSESVLAEILTENEVAEVFASNDDRAAQARIQSLFQGEDITLLVLRAETEDMRQASVGQFQRLGSLSAGIPANNEALAWEALAQASDAKSLLQAFGGVVTRYFASAVEKGRTVWRRMLPGSDRIRIAREQRRKMRGLTVAQKSDKRLPDDRLMLVGMIALLAAVVFVAYGVVRWQAGRIRESRTQRMIATVEAEIESVKNAATTEEARPSLEKADAILRQLDNEGIQSENLEVLARDLAEQLDKIDRVERLYWLPALRRYEEAGAYTSKVLTHGIDVYVLDDGLDRIYKYLFNPLLDGLQELGAEVPEILMRIGDVRDDATTNALVDMTWMSPGAGREWASLLVLQEGGGLLEYEPSTGIKVLPAGPRTQLQQPRAMAGFEGRLLIVDAALNQILVYEPGSGNYDLEPMPYTNADLMLSGVVDMAVDGDVYLLYADGLVAKLRGGEQLNFQLVGLNKRIVNPTALCVTQDQEGRPGFVYIADSGNNRVLQFSKDGQFIRQFMPKRGDNSFENLTGIAVDEAAGKMVVLANNTLLLANIPQ